MRKETILVVDDLEINREILEEMLKEEYNVIQAADGLVAIAVMFSASALPSMVLLDIMMPEMDGYEVLEMMQNNTLTAKIPVIFITAAGSENNETKGLSLGAVDFISKPFNNEVVKARVSNHLKLKRYSENLEDMVEEKVTELLKAKEKMLDTLANIIEYRNLETGQHIKRTSGLTKLVLKHLYHNPEYNRHVPLEEHDVIIKAVPLHDTGKIAIPDNILLKPGKLTPEEFEIMKTHTTLGCEIIMSMMDEDDTNYRTHCLDICRHHHERWDGKGYPDGLSVEAIPLSARILAAVDVYDALISPRVYKPAFPHEKAIDIMSSGAGTQFDPMVIKAVLELQYDFQKFEEELQQE